MAKQTLFEDVVVRSLKIVDIGYASAVYFIMALASVYALNRVIKIKPETIKRRSTTQLVVDVILHVWLIGVLAYFARNLIEKIPSPMEGIYGFQHLKVKEIGNAAPYVAFMVTFDTNLQRTVTELKERMGF